VKKKIIITTILALVVIWAIFHFHRNNQNKNVPLTVEVKKGTIVEKAEAIGYIQPRHLITIKAEIGGKVAKIFHYEGSFVQKGTALIEIEPTPQPSDYATAYQAVLEKKAIEKSTLQHFDRFKAALKKGIISKDYQDYINSEQNYETAKQLRILAEHQLALLQVGSTTVGGKSIGNVVFSPIDGYILDRKVDVGDSVISLSSAQASTALFTIANMKDILFEGSLDEIDASKVKLGMPATITVGALPDKKITGKVTRISLQSEQKSGNTIDQNLPFNVSFKVEISELSALPIDTTIRAGYSSTADIILQTANDILILPERVIHFDESNNPYVLMAPTKPNVAPQKQPVKIGLSDGINVEITEGLKSGDFVVDQQTSNPPA
jgi:HlyD family secretion protein